MYDLINKTQQDYKNAFPITVSFYLDLKNIPLKDQNETKICDFIKNNVSSLALNLTNKN